MREVRSTISLGGLVPRPLLCSCLEKGWEAQSPGESSEWNNCFTFRGASCGGLEGSWTPPCGCFSGHVPLDRYPEFAGETRSLAWYGNTLEFPHKNWSKWSGEGSLGMLTQTAATAPRYRMKTDKWYRDPKQIVLVNFYSSPFFRWQKNLTKVQLIVRCW